MKISKSIKKSTVIRSNHLNSVTTNILVNFLFINKSNTMRKLTIQKFKKCVQKSTMSAALSMDRKWAIFNEIIFCYMMTCFGSLQKNFFESCQVLFCRLVILDLKHSVYAWVYFIYRYFVELDKVDIFVDQFSVIGAFS